MAVLEQNVYNRPPGTDRIQKFERPHGQLTALNSYKSNHCAIKEITYSEFSGAERQITIF